MSREILSIASALVIVVCVICTEMGAEGRFKCSERSLAQCSH